MDGSTSSLLGLYRSLDSAALEAWRSRREPESITLDFKRFPPDGNLSDNDVKILQKVLSGFANSDGGIVLWGVESKSAANKADRSRFDSYHPIQDPDRLIVRLIEEVTKATQPPVSGVLHEKVPVPGGWVVKTFVPASDRGPHRTARDDGQYYRRDADEFRPMHHFQIADMFGRRARADLVLVFKHPSFDRGRPGGWDDWLHGDIVLINRGRGLARFPLVTMEALHPALRFMPPEDPNRWTLVPRSRHHDSPRIALYGGADDVIHSQEERLIARLRVESINSLRQKDLSINWSLYAEGIESTAGQAVFKYQDLWTFVEAGRRH